MRIKAKLTSIPNCTVEMVLDPVLDHKELQNVNDRNKHKVGAAIARKRFKQECDGVPHAVFAVA